MVACQTRPAPLALATVQSLLLAKCFQRMRTAEPGGGSLCSVALTVQAAAFASRGAMSNVSRPGPGARAWSSQAAAGGNVADAGGREAATQSPTAATQGP